ncbi:hypothetical protein OC835_006788 [Tilletia horrida]|nr:hypothetical protein OC835_006788 [Tilletia horrida]
MMSPAVDAGNHHLLITPFGLSFDHLRDWEDVILGATFSSSDFPGSIEEAIASKECGEDSAALQHINLQGLLEWQQRLEDVKRAKTRVNALEDEPSSESELDAFNKARYVDLVVKPLGEPARRPKWTLLEPQQFPAVWQLAHAGRWWRGLSVSPNAASQAISAEYGPSSILAVDALHIPATLSDALVCAAAELPGAYDDLGALLLPLVPVHFVSDHNEVAFHGMSAVEAIASGPSTLTILKRLYSLAHVQSVVPLYAANVVCSSDGTTFILHEWDPCTDSTTYAISTTYSKEETSP